MSITRVSAGAFHDVFNAANTPVAGTFLAGDFIFIFTGELMGSNTLTTPSGWTLCSPNNNAKQNACFGLQSVTGSESMPSLSWGNQWSYADVVVYRGLSSLTPTNSSDRQSNHTQNIVGPAVSVTPSQDNSLVILFGSRNKTSTSDGTVFSAPSNFTLVGSDVQSGSRPAPAICEWIQTTATAIPANTSISGSKADGTTQTNQGIIMVFAPSVAIPPGAQGL